MSNSKESRILIIGEVAQGRRIAEAPLLPETGALARDPRVEWLFFYHDNMGIITEQYKGRLITGYPVLAFREAAKPFNDSVSRELFREFFERFLFAKKTRVVVAATQVAFEAITAILKKKNIRLVLYQPDAAPGTIPRIKKAGDITVCCLKNAMNMEQKDSSLKEVESFESLISSLAEEV